MTEINSVPEETLDPATRAGALLDVVLLSFSGKVEVDGSVRVMPRDDFQAKMDIAFPDMTKEQLAASERLGSWGIRNVIINRLGGVDPEIVSAMTGQLAELAGGDDTSLRVAEHIGQVIGKRDRQQALPMLAVLSSMAVERRLSH